MRTPGRSRYIGAIVLAASVWACDGATGGPARMVSPPLFALGNDYSAWSAPTIVTALNSAKVDGCPFISPDGKTFFIASNRDNGVGLLDIYVSTRSTVNEPWSAPANVTSINSTADDFCPTISRDGKLLYFVSRRPSACSRQEIMGGVQGDIYVARRGGDGTFGEPELLPCDGEAPYEAVNSPYDEFSPFPQREAGVGPTLYFSSFRPGGFAADAGTPDSDLYRSVSHGGVFRAADLIPTVNSARDDAQPNVGSDGLELFFYSTRDGAAGQDLYVATRARSIDGWSAPSSLGAVVNSGANDSRPSLSWDGLSLYFGSTRGGPGVMSDIYVTTRQRLVKENN